MKNNFSLLRSYFVRISRSFSPLTSYFLLLTSSPRSCLLLFTSLTLISCAGQQPPTGGPADTTHPKIDTTFPRDRQTNVSRNARLYFQFDRDVDKTSFQQALSISPYINGALKFDWSGHNEVWVGFSEPLRDSTTYTVSLARQASARDPSG